MAKLILRWRSVVILAGHALAFALIFHLAYLLRFDGAVPPKELALAIRALPFVLGLKLAVFVSLGNYRGWLRYVAFADIVGICESATVGSVSMVAVSWLVGPGWLIPRSIIVLDWAGTILVLGGVRASVRVFRERYYPMLSTRSFRRVLVVGASEAGAALIRQIQGQPDLGMKVVGLLDPDPRLRGRTMAGVRVLGPLDQMRRQAARLDVHTVLIPTPAVSADQIRIAVALCGEAKVKAQVVPGFDAFLSGALTVQPRDINLEDLLCREPVTLDDEAVGRLLRGRVVLITGAAGSIGSELCRQALAFQPATLVLLDHSENGLFYLERELRGLAGAAEIVVQVASIADSRRLCAIFDQHQPAVVLHAAAHKHVPLMETNPGEAIKNNVLGTRTLVDSAVWAGVETLVMISTDKAVNPSSVMGVSKRLAEMYVQALSSEVKSRLVTVRFGNVLGSNGSVVPVFKEQIRRGGPITVTHPEMTRYFMTIPEATQLVLQAGALGKGGEIFVLDMGKPVKVVDLARDLIRLSGLSEGRDIEIVFTGPRPGEKLHEELYDKRERRLPTPHPKIFTAQHRPCPLDQLREQFDLLAQLVEGPADRLIAHLGELVPEYSPGPLAEGRTGRERAGGAVPLCLASST